MASLPDAPCAPVQVDSASAVDDAPARLRPRSSELSESEFDAALAAGRVVRSPPDLLLYACPHCRATVSTAAAEVNCTIFRHGVDPLSWQPLNPHAAADDAARSVARWDEKGTVVHGTGCGKQYTLRACAASADHPADLFAPFQVEVCEGR